MQFHEYRDFTGSLLTLKRRFGQYQAAAEKLEALAFRIGKYSQGVTTDDPLAGLTCTRNGETRIRHCVKYHLSGFARLVTFQTDKQCILLYAGTHDDVECWLAKHAGFVFLVDSANKIVTSFNSTEGVGVLLEGEAGTYPHELFRRLSDDEFGALVDGVPYRITKSLQELRTGFVDSELKATLGVLNDRERSALINDVFAMLNADRVEQARARIRQSRNELQPIDTVPEDRLPQVVNAEILRSYATDSAIFGTLLKQFANTATYRDWMLFMHPDQEQVVDEDFEGPAKLVGVSGSGKTCVVVRRALRLAEKYSGQRILIVTLNRALAALIDDLVTSCTDEHTRRQIEVKPFFVLCQEILGEQEPAKKRGLDEYTDKHREHVDEVWQEYYRCELNNTDALAFQPVHDSLLARRCSPEKYLREELNWLRSAFTTLQRKTYLHAQRHGRRYPIPQHFREAILEGAVGWEAKMEAIGVIDTLGLAQKLSESIGYLPSRYRCILVDEVQDFGNIELEIVYALMQPGENSLFLTGDAAQAVTTKYQSFSAIGLQFPTSRSRVLSRNYRNSADVLQAAYSVLMENISENMIENEDLRIMDPEASSFTGTAPTLLEAVDLQAELRYALAAAREKVTRQPHAKVCISVCGYSLEEMRRYGARLKLPVLDGKSRIDEHSIFLSDLAHTKGFEFDMVCIVNCSEGVLPDRHLPEEESSREIAMLYVAMTRAKMDLCISWSGRLSHVFDESTKHFDVATWEDYMGPVDELPPAWLPERTEEFRVEADRRPWQAMSGNEFLHSTHVIGLPIELIQKLRELTNGPAQRKGRVDIRWSCVGDAVESCRRSPQSAIIWGPQMSRQLLDLADRLPQRR